MAYSNHKIIPVPRTALLQGHYRTHCGAFVEQSNLEHYFFWLNLLSKVSPVVQSSEWIATPVPRPIAGISANHKSHAVIASLVKIIKECGLVKLREDLVSDIMH